MMRLENENLLTSEYEQVSEAAHQSALGKGVLQATTPETALSLEV